MRPIRRRSRSERAAAPGIHMAVLHLPAHPEILSAVRGGPTAIHSEASPVQMEAALNTGIRTPVRTGLPEIPLGTMVLIHSPRFSEGGPVLQARGQDPMQIRIWMRLHMSFAPAEIAIGNRISALDHARAAIRMSPGDPEYQQLLSEIESGSRAYRRTRAGSGYDFQSLICQNPCITCFAVNMLINCCCGRAFWC